MRSPEEQSLTGSLQAGLGGYLSATSLICKWGKKDEAFKASLNHNESLERKRI